MRLLIKTWQSHTNDIGYNLKLFTKVNTNTLWHTHARAQNSTTYNNVLCMTHEAAHCMAASHSRAAD